MLDNKSILELKRRFKKENCTVTNFCGCYVDANKQKVTTFQKNLLNIDDSEYFKYLEILAKSLSGKINRNLLDISFKEENTLEHNDNMKQYLLRLRESELKNPELIDILYDRIIESYDYVGNYIILVFYDAYDVITKTKDNIKLDESEEVFRYLICSICPVSLSKPGLGYQVEEKEFAAVEQDWMIKIPDVAFMYPSFVHRSSDENTVTYYVRKPLEAHPEVPELLGCTAKMTSTEQKTQLEHIIKKHIGFLFENTEEKILEIETAIKNTAESNNEEAEAIGIDSNNIHEILIENHVPEKEAKYIKEDYETNLCAESIPAANLYDEKQLKQYEKKNREHQLMQELNNKEVLTKQHIVDKIQERYRVDESITVSTIIEFINNMQ